MQLALVIEIYSFLVKAESRSFNSWLADQLLFLLCHPKAFGITIKLAGVSALKGRHPLAQGAALGI
jgi:hypothetical protein